MQDKKLFLSIYYLLILVYWELIFKLLIIDRFWHLSLINSIVFLFGISLFLTIITSFFTTKKNRYILVSIVVLLSIWFSFEFVFFKIFDVFFSIANFGLADQAFAFWGEAIKYCFKYSYGILIMFIPLITTLLLKYRISTDKRSGKYRLKILLVLLIVCGLFHLSLLIGKDKTYSAYQIYYNVNDNSLSINKLGVLPAAYLEISRFIFGFEEPTDKLVTIKQEKPKKEEPVVYNITDINFDTLEKNETDNTLKSMHNYFANDLGTKQNDYTGYYKGKNLILFMAESFNSIAVSKELTPTLYKLSNEGFVFENFYTPVMLSTLGGEFQELNGLYPSLLNSVWRGGNNYFPYGYGTIFNNLGYNTYAYHDNQYNFQSRNVYLKSLGFNNFLGCYNGLEKRINCYEWPESDIDMINTTTIDYLSSTNPFMTYYVTVSGHMPYSWNGIMSKKYKSLLTDLKVSDRAKAYQASQIELDKALESLINQLQESGQLENTVIALVGDHYPYDLDLATINELSSYKRDSVIEINRSNFILWNSNTPKTIIKKVGCQVDVLPTLLNLFGVKYDSRLLIGKDILSDEPGIAIFNNRSWVSDYGKYYSSSAKFELSEGKKVDSDYVEKMNNVVSSKLTMSNLILQKNYYYKILGG